MKKIIAFIAIILHTTTSIAQDKAMLTKEETVSYIEKKLKDIVTFPSRSDIGSYTSATLYLRDAKIHIYLVCNFKSAYTSEIEMTFDPAKILSIEKGSTGSDVDLLVLNIAPNTAKHVKVVTQADPQPNNYNYQSKNTKTLQPSKLEIPYLRYDGTNFNKLKKAFEHLRDLCKAEDDPFGQ